jgi:dienelactone hydrolase
LVLSLALFAPAASSLAADETQVPVEAFYRHPDIDSAALSPSGARVAVLTGVGAPRVRLAVFDLQDKAPPRVVAQFSDADINNFYWVNDRVLVLGLADLSAGGGEQEQRGLWGARADGGGVWRILDRMLLSVPIGGGNEIIVGRVARHVGEPIAVYPSRLDLTTGQQHSLAVDAPDYALGWIFEPKGEPRVVLATHEGQTRIYWRAPGRDAWTEIAKFDALNMAFAPRFVDATGQLYVTSAEGAERYAVLKRFDFVSGKPESDAFVKTPGFDFWGALIAPEGVAAATLGIRVTTDAETTVWLDERMKKIQQDVDARLPGHINRLSCRKCGSDDIVVLVFTYSDQDPGQFFVYRPSKNDWRSVGRIRPDIDPKRMATLDLHRIHARDGLELPVWVTRPPGDRTSARPAVVLVHGGPWIRGEYWHWSGDAQFLASRGYVVIEPEFRGSTGYGTRHFRAGWKQWGRAMQDDVDDALDWAVGQGWVDAKRVCIAGASYGGYATLMGLIRTPERYRCGVAWAAVTDLRLPFEWSWGSDVSEEARLYSSPVLIGDPKQDAAALAEVSPFEQAARIKTPLLLAFGAKDRRVPLDYGTKLRAALRAAGQEPEWVLYEDEGHGWLKPANKIDFARRVEAFLAKYLK